MQASILPSEPTLLAKISAPRIDNSKQNKDNLIFKSTIVVESKKIANCESEGR